MKACKEKNIGTTIMKVSPYNRYFEAQEFIEKMKQEEKPVPEWMNNLLLKYEQLKEQSDSFIKQNNLSGKDEIKAAAIRFVLGNPDADCVLPSITSFEDIDNFVRTSGKPLSSTDKKTLRDYEKSFGTYYCRHACGICETKCPHEIPINTIMRYDHYFHAQHQHDYAKRKYAELSGAKANRCIDCQGYCEAACPYNVPIKGLLTIAHNNLTNTA